MARTSPLVRRSLVALVAFLALAGCSSSGGEDATTTTEARATTEAATDTEPTETTEPDTTETTERDTTETTDGGEAGEVCDALQAISDYDVASGELVNGGADWPELQAFFVDNTESVLAAYDDAIAADSEVTDELIVLRDFTEGTGDLAADSSSLEDFGSKLTSNPDVLEAGQAGETLNTFAEENCGFSTGGAGN